MSRLPRELGSPPPPLGLDSRLDCGRRGAPIRPRTLSSHGRTDRDMGGLHRRSRRGPCGSHNWGSGERSASPDSSRPRHAAREAQGRRDERSTLAGGPRRRGQDTLTRNAHRKTLYGIRSLVVRSGHYPVAQVARHVKRNECCDNDYDNDSEHYCHSFTHGYLAFIPARSPLPSLRCEVRQVGDSGIMTCWVARATWFRPKK